MELQRRQLSIAFISFSLYFILIIIDFTITIIIFGSPEDAGAGVTVQGAAPQRLSIVSSKLQAQLKPGKKVQRRGKSALMQKVNVIIAAENLESIEFTKFQRILDARVMLPS